MSSSPPGKSDSDARHVTDEQAVAVGESARPTDDTPTVISKAPPIVEPATAIQDKFIDLNRKPTSPESIVAGLRGRRLAHFELIEPIGVGGMAAVIRARDTQLDRFVALKILPPEMAQERENIQRFHQEAKAAAKLDHANIARVFYGGEDQGLYFIAFEFVEGMNLRALMEQRGRLPVPESIRYILQIAAGLEHAASRGVVHRDVKPSNIIITPHGQAKLVDMGLARNLERRGEHDLTQSGVTLGTFDYISPEQALEPREADARSDIYSLGCTLYHMLTGQPPVPEGTPAKKLQHHQHHAPIDPRQLNPEIPDEIVMILGKMMAKDPADRYQRPIHLVQHMMQIAQQVGAADDLPEGVLFVDAILPGTPRSRPVLMIALALAALAVVTLLFSLAPEGKTPGGPTPTPSDETKLAQPNAGFEKPSLDQVDLTPAPAPAFVENLANLKNVLGDHSSTEVKSKIKESIDLGSTGLTFKGSSDQTLVLEPAHEEGYAIIRFQYKSTGSAVGLTLQSGKEVVFRRIMFLIDSDGTPDRPAAAVAVRGVKNVKFENCIFAQTNHQRISSRLVPLASILIDAPEKAEQPRPSVSVSKCYFDGTSEKNGGQVAMAIDGAATISVSNSAFQPHVAFFSFRDKCKNTALDLQNCSGFVEMGPAFRFSKDASAQVSVRKSVFSRPEGRLEGGLIYLAGENSLQYEGRQNLYHNLNTLLQKDKLIIANLNEFQDYLLKENNGADVNSIEMFGTTPSPLQHRNPLASNDPLLAFQLQPQYHNKKLGLQSSWLGDMPAPQIPFVKAATEKIVDTEDGGKTPGVFSTIAEALIRAKDGDTIYVKHGENPKLVVPPITLRAGISVTIKPHKGGYRPILVLDKDFEKKESALFEVQKSKLRFEEMEFLLDPETGYSKRSIVQMGEAAELVFEKCIFSLRATNRVVLSVVTFVDLDRLMKMETSSPALAQVEFHECFVRGKGDLVALQGCRKLNVEMTNSLVALDGSLLNIEAASKTMPMTQGVNWKMERSSIFTTVPVFALNSKPGTVLTETHAKIKDCLLASLGSEQDVVSPDMDKLSKYLKWECEHNYYANFDKDKLRDWQGKVPEVISDFGKVTFPKLSDEAKRTLWDATSEMFKPADSEQERLLRDFGIPPESEQRFLPPPNPDES